MHLQQPQDGMTQGALDVVELSGSHFGDFFKHMGPVDAFNALAARDAGQESGLGFRPSQNVS